ncbi:hypothetical protein OIU77_005956 [Salix suchowensis]|uniref:DUF4283 domain-containing protein n=1 Tax=Salix suchowensis TaxID=1278906 RepID=A0ABQ9ATE5_9ROSI|nr:hypothetical protein OIU77_005956 [Salix suchowensis]
MEPSKSLDEDSAPVALCTSPYGFEYYKQKELAIAAKVLGHILKHDQCTGLKTKTIWNGAKPFKVIDPENEFFLVQFSTMNDYLHVLVDGPWTILGPGQNFQAWITWTHYKDGVLGAFSLPFQLIGNMYKIDYNTQNNH